MCGCEVGEYANEIVDIYVEYGCMWVILILLLCGFSVIRALLYSNDSKLFYDNIEVYYNLPRVTRRAWNLFLF